jgi:hypothetical protein
MNQRLPLDPPLARRERQATNHLLRFVLQARIVAALMAGEYRAGI